MVQARPETVQSLKTGSRFTLHHLLETGPVLATGAAIGDSIAQGTACVIRSAADIEKFRDGAILVTEMTDPDWVPIMKRAAGIVTDHGGPTSHAAIVSRELGVPAVVGTGNATGVLAEGQAVTLSCAEGDQGRVYAGSARVRNRGRGPGRAAGDAHQSHGQHRQPRGRLPVVAAARGRRRAGPDGVHHQRPDPGPSDGAGPSGAGHGPAGGGADPGADARLRRPTGLLRGRPGAGHREDRRAVPPEPGDRAAQRLQDQRVRAPGGRFSLRGGRGEPHAGVPRRLALLRRAVPGGVRARMPGPEAGPGGASASATSS